jgi:hypothetical protein
MTEYGNGYHPTSSKQLSALSEEYELHGAREYQAAARYGDQHIAC